MDKKIIIGFLIFFIAAGVGIFTQFTPKSAVLDAKATNKVIPTKSFSKITPVEITPTRIPTRFPTYIPVQAASTPTPENYQNYGWYMHDGKTMQYFNGSWYATPQQDNTPTPSPTPVFSCPPGVPGYYCEQNCRNISASECSNKYNEWWSEWQQQQQAAQPHY